MKYIVYGQGQTNNQTINKIYTKDIKVLFGLVFVEIIIISSTNRYPERSLSSQSLGKY